MSDEIATLAIEVESSGTQAAAESLDALASAAEQADAAAEALIAQFKAGQASATQLAEALRALQAGGQGATASAQGLEAALRGVGTSAETAAAGISATGAAATTASAAAGMMSRELAGAVNGSFLSGLNTARASLLTFRSGLLSIAVAVGIFDQIGKSFTDFDDAIRKVEAFTTAGKTEIESLRDPIRQLAADTGISASALADALYHIESGGQHGALALNELKLVSLAAAAGMGDANTIAQTLSQTIAAYGPGVLSADSAMNTMVNTIRQGDLGIDQLAGAMGRVLPIAAAMGLRFADVGAAIAAMTREGATVPNAVTGLRSLLVSIQGESAGARKELIELTNGSVSFDALRDQLKAGDFLGAMQQLKGVIGDNDEALKRMEPNVRAEAAVIALLGNNAEAVNEIFQRTREDHDSLTDAVTKTDSASRHLAQSWQELKNTMSDVGDVALRGVNPVFAALADTLKTVDTTVKTLANGDFNKAFFNDYLGGSLDKNPYNEPGASRISGVKVDATDFASGADLAGPVARTSSAGGGDALSKNLQDTFNKIDQQIAKQKELNAGRAEGADALARVTAAEKIYQEAQAAGFTIDDKVKAELASRVKVYGDLLVAQNHLTEVTKQASKDESQYQSSIKETIRLLQEDDKSDSKVRFTPIQQQDLVDQLHGGLSKSAQSQFDLANSAIGTLKTSPELLGFDPSNQQAITDMIAQLDNYKLQLGTTKDATDEVTKASAVWGETVSHAFNSLSDSFARTLTAGKGLKNTFQDLGKEFSEFATKALILNPLEAGVQNYFNPNAKQNPANPTLEPQDIAGGVSKLWDAGSGFVKGLFGLGGPSAGVPGVGQGTSDITNAAIASTGALTIDTAAVIGGNGSGSSVGATAFNGALGALGFGAGGGGSADLGTAFDAFASSGDFSSLVGQGLSFLGFAKGGVVRRPTIFPMATGLGLMGEAGPEAILPLARHSDGSLGVKSSGGGGSDSAPGVVIHNYSGQPATATQQRDSRGRRSIAVQIGQVGAHDIKTGGPMSQQLGRSYGLSRSPIQR